MTAPAAALALVTKEPAALAMSGGVRIDGLRDVFMLAERLAQARGFVPDAYAGKPEALAACILTGVELGLGPMTAMREIHIIKGKPSISATLMLSLAQRAGIKTRWLKTDSTSAIIGVTVPGQAEQTLGFTAEQAKAAALWGQGNWKTYPDAMLRARATSAAMRAFCPGVLGGSVYESESGELPPQAVEVTVLPVETATERAAPTKPEECATAADLEGFCRKHAARITSRADRVAKIEKRAVELEVLIETARGWLGLDVPPSTVDDDEAAAMRERGEDPGA